MDQLQGAMKKLRKNLGLTQKQLAAKLYLTPHAISQYETGKRSVTLKTFEAFLKKLNIDISELEVYLTTKDFSKTAIKGIHVSSVKYLETSRGVAYTAPIILDGNQVGFIENKGDGGMTSIYLNEQKNEFNKRMEEHLSAYNGEKTGIDEETFAEHLLDMYEFGKILSFEEKEAIFLNQI